MLDVITFSQLCASSVTRGHAYINVAGSHFFACRVISEWNSLPVTTDYSTINAFRHSVSDVDLTQF